MGLVKEFLDFLKEYKIVGLAIAFIMGIASKDLVDSLVKHVMMPFLNPLIPGGTWKEAKLAIGPVEIGWGLF